jgi:hypothetical protein
MWIGARIGSNSVVGSEVDRTAVLLAGNRLLVLEAPADRALRLSAEIYDERGRREGVLLSNRWQVEQLNLTLECANDRLRLVRGDSNLLLDVAVIARELVVSRLDLWTRDGHRCVVDDAGRLCLSAARRPTSVVVSGRIVHAPLQQIDLGAAFAQSTSARRDR